METRVDKRAVLGLLQCRISAEIARSTGQAVDAAAGATHEENSAEGDKDMRSTEASYVARGHAERVQTLKESLATLTVMVVRDFAAGEGIASSAVVEVESDGARATYFVVPVSGGERVVHGDVEIRTLTTTSPLGAALLGLAEGDEAEVATPKGPRSYEVLSVR